MSNIDWVNAVEQYYAENPDSNLDSHEVEAHLRNEYERILEGKMSEMELIYKFFAEYRNTGGVHPDGAKFAAYASFEDDMDTKTAWANGETIGDAIRQLYDILEKEKVGK